MALNRTEIEQVVAEILPVLRSGWIQKIHQPTDQTLLFEIRLPGQTHRLLISCRPETARLHLTSRTLPNPQTPPVFCQFLRAHLQGARIDDIRQVPDDRIVEISCTGKDGLRTIVCELIGKNANILVLNADRQVIRDLHHQRDRVGQPYAHPAQRPNDSRDPTPTRFAGTDDCSVSAAIEAFYGDREATISLDRAKEARLRALKQTLKKERRRIDAWRADLDRAAKYRDYARYGELIKANLGTIGKGIEHITVTDYFDERLPEITIPMDPTKSPQGNMDDYFRKHRKYVSAERELKPRIEQAERSMGTLREELLAVESGAWIPPNPAPGNRGTAAREKPRGGSHPQETRRGPFRRFTSSDGFAIFVGRNAKENDELTFGLAKSDDLWLHARGTPGSHVVVRLGKSIDPPHDTIRDAATLALLYSDLKKSGKGEVIYTRRKWVKKAKGQAPGAVLVTQEKSIHVSLDKTRLDALKIRSSSDSS
ncbi:MAG: NFACT family protein [Nitrospira sp.]|nr:NFACT family protein [Nitrospira sp.]